MKIYFDENKIAHGYEIENYIAIVDDSVWNNFASDTVGTTWDIVDGKFTGDIIEKRKKEFYDNFISLSIGNYRKKPRGYASAVESFNVMDSIVNKLSSLPANTIVVYPSPNFTDGNQCSEEWLEANKIVIDRVLSKEEFNNLYIEFTTKWNNTEHEV